MLSTTTRPKKSPSIASLCTDRCPKTRRPHSPHCLSRTSFALTPPRRFQRRHESASASLHGLAVQVPRYSAMRKPSSRLLALVRLALPRAALWSTWREAAKLPPRVMRWLPSVSQPSRQALPSVSGPDRSGAGKALANLHTHLQTQFGMHASLLFHTCDTASEPCSKTPTPRPRQGVGDGVLLALLHCDVRDA